MRHGQSTWNEEGRIQGSSDFSILTSKGEAQAETTRKMLQVSANDVELFISSVTQPVVPACRGSTSTLVFAVP